ncbi:hypothetical protein L6R53_17205 [Myxococcota bacterium]|nr:hypothetical protein [Myxococcota bacterium]
MTGSRPTLARALLLAPWLAPAPARAGEAVQTWDLEADDGGFTSTGEVPLWEWGAPLGGPSAAHSGSRLWGTDLDDRYLRENRVELALAAFDLSVLDAPTLVLWSWLDLADGDLAFFEVDDGAGWQRAEPVYGYPVAGSLADADLAWAPLYLDLSGLDDLSQVRLVLQSDAGRAWGWYVDDVGVHTGDAVPPRIDAVDAPETWSTFDQGPTIVASIQDDQALTSISVAWSTDEVETTLTGFSPSDDGTWTATLPPLPPGTVSWTVQASDGENLSTWPPSGEAQTRILLPAPGDLAGPAGRHWGTTIPLTWTAPEAEDAVLGYRVYRDGALVAEPLSTAAEVPAAGPVDSLEVTALFRTGIGDFEGDPAGPLQVEVAVPAVSGLEPAEAWPQDRLRIALSGQNLLLDGATLQPEHLDLGEGVQVEAVEVEHVDRAVFTVAVDPAAAPGARDATLEVEGLPLTLAAAFTVRSDEDRPAITQISPDALEQGERATLTLSLSSAPAATPVVDLGEELVIEAVQVDGAQLKVQVAVGNGAPVGLRDVTVDDGVRILTLEDGFRVWSRTVTVAPDCACAGAPPAGPAGSLLALLAGLSWRRRRSARNPSDCAPPSL